MKRINLFLLILLLSGLLLSRTAVAFSLPAANIDVTQVDAGISLPWLLLGAFVVALVVTLILRAMMGRRGDAEQADS